LSAPRLLRRVRTNAAPRSVLSPRAKFLNEGALQRVARAEFFVGGHHERGLGLLGMWHLGAANSSKGLRGSFPIRCSPWPTSRLNAYAQGGAKGKLSVFRIHPPDEATV
jgi:hypothetical protein